MDYAAHCNLFLRVEWPFRRDGATTVSGVTNNRIETRSVRRLRTGPQATSCNTWRATARLSEHVVLKSVDLWRICSRNLIKDMRRMHKTAIEKARSIPSFRIP